MLLIVLVVVGQAAGDRQFRRAGEETGARDLSRVDFVADDDVEPRLGRGGADRRGETHIQSQLGVMHGEENMLLHRQARELGDGGAIVVG